VITDAETPELAAQTRSSAITSAETPEFATQTRPSAITSAETPELATRAKLVCDHSCANIPRIPSPGVVYDP
jgi:hypothetical protein